MPRHGPAGRRGGHAPRRGVRRRAPCRALGRRPARAAHSARQQQVGRRTGDGAGARRRPHRRRLLRRDRPPGRHCWSPRAPRTASGPRSWCGSRPVSRRTRTSSCAPGRRTRSSASPSPPARRREAVAALELMPGGRAGRRARAHRQPGLRGVLLRAGGRGARRVLRAARSARARRRGWARRPLRQRRVGADARPPGPRRRGAPARRRAWARPRGSRPSPGVPSWPRRA